MSEDPIRSHLDEINILVSFDAETIFRHADKVTRGGAIIYDSDLSSTTLQEVPTIDEPAAKRIRDLLEKSENPITVNGMVNFAKNNGAVLYDIPYFGILKQFSVEINEPALSKLTRMINVMALSASMAILDFDKEILAKAIKIIFKAKPKIADGNVLGSKLCIRIRQIAI